VRRPRGNRQQVISELARQALAEPRQRLDFSKVEIVDGIPVLPSRGGVVTKELVDQLIEEAGFKDARSKGGY
jgi:hypothetical protein